MAGKGAAQDQSWPRTFDTARDFNDMCTSLWAARSDVASQREELDTCAMDMVLVLPRKVLTAKKAGPRQFRERFLSYIV